MVWQTRLLCDGLRGCLCSAATVDCAGSCECRRVLPEKPFCNGPHPLLHRSGSGEGCRFVMACSRNFRFGKSRTGKRPQSRPGPIDRAALPPASAFTTNTAVATATMATHQHVDFFLALTTLLLSHAAITTRAPTSHRPPSKTSYLASATLRFPGLEATISTSVLC